jgi:restriction system protein
MDLTTVFTQLMSSIWPLFLMGAFIMFLKTAWFKGIAGEFFINLRFSLSLDKEKYHLIKNVTLPTENGTTQIDHIIVSEFGVFVIETKNMKGWIFGSQNQKTWTQKIYKKSYQFQNPLHQNYKHLKTLQSLLSLRNDQIFSVVAFVGGCTFKTEMPENVTKGKNCIRFIKSKYIPVLTQQEANTIYDKICSGRLKPSYKTNREHIAHVKSVVTQKNTAQRCPKCNNSMVLREVKKGENSGNKFWGCSTYPKCRGTVNSS